MALLDLKTDLKSLKYGQDRPDGGSSGQPYIQTDINTIDRGFNRLRLTKFDDGLIRGGIIGATNAAVTDTLRIGKFLTDAPKGPLFIVKQVGLQLSNPRLEVPKNPFNIVQGGLNNVLSAGTNGLLEPTRIYNLGINTIAQIPVNAFGGHFNRHGILPVQNEASKYEAIVTANNNLPFSNNPSKNNRLVGLAAKFQLGKPEVKPNTEINKARTFLGRLATTLGLNIPGLKPSDLIIDDYKGGPGSVYGILGRTTINRTLQITNDKSKIDSSRNYSTIFAGKTRDDEGNPISIDYTKDLGNPIPNSSTGYRDISEYLGTDAIELEDPNKINTINDISSYIKNEGINVVDYGDRIGTVGTYGKLRTQIEKQNKLTQSYYDGNITGSFTSSISSKDSFVTHDSKNYHYYGNKRIVSGSFGSKAIYNNTEVYSRKDADILTVIFRAINPFSDYTNTETIKERWAFSAYVNGFKDSFDAIWNETNYVGRAESFYIYNKFKRSVSFNLQIPCFNKVELFKKHRALGQLASTTAGSYNNNLLGGVILQLNVGNYIVGEYAILNSISYEIPNDSAWDVSSDALLAMNINASFNFNIIHKQLPQYTQTSKSNPNTGFFGYLTNPPIPKPNQGKLNQNIKDADFFISSEKLKEFTKD